MVKSEGQRTGYLEHDLAGLCSCLACRDLVVATRNKQGVMVLKNPPMWAYRICVRRTGCRMQGYGPARRDHGTKYRDEVRHAISGCIAMTLPWKAREKEVAR